MTEQHFSIQFVVLRDGQPITPLLQVDNTPVSLHEKHDKGKVWAFQAQTLVALVRAALMEIRDMLGPCRYHVSDWPSSIRLWWPR